MLSIEIQIISFLQAGSEIDCGFISHVKLSHSTSPFWGLSFLLFHEWLQIKLAFKGHPCFKFELVVLSRLIKTNRFCWRAKAASNCSVIIISLIVTVESENSPAENRLHIPLSENGTFSLLQSVKVYARENVSQLTATLEYDNTLSTRSSSTPLKTSTGRETLSDSRRNQSIPEPRK